MLNEETKVKLLKFIIKLFFNKFHFNVIIL